MVPNGSLNRIADVAQVSDKSVWSSTPRGAGADKLDQDDMKELESLFAVKPSLKTPTAVGPRIIYSQVIVEAGAQE